ATTDMLYAIPVLLTAGTEPPIQNVASAINRGWEFSLNYRQFKGAFKYSLGANVTFIKNGVTDLGPGGIPIVAGRVQSANASVSRTEVGQPIGSFYGFVTD